MLQFDPSKRPTASECLQYPFFRVRVPIPLNAPTDTSPEEIDKMLDDMIEEEVEEQTNAHKKFQDK
jgi:serine/threonine protein kinase